MTKDDVIRMADAADCYASKFPDTDLDYWEEKRDMLFAALVRNAALEEAACKCKSMVDTDWPSDDLSCQAEALASDIRAMKSSEFS